MWEGIDRNEARELKQEDVDVKIDKVTILLSDRAIEVIEPGSIDIIKNFTRSGYDIEQKNGRGRSYEYANTEMLLRNTSKRPVTKHTTISESSINNYYTEQAKKADELPESSDYYGKRLVFRGISDSGAFYRLNQEGKTGRITREEIARARQISSVTASIVESFNFIYQGWRKYFGHE
jgi:hypothetical protein